MKLVEVAQKVLKRRQREAWFSRRIELLEVEEVARRMGITVATVNWHVWQATRTLADHAADIEDPDSYLACMISILQGHRIENEPDLTVQSVLKREERALLAAGLDKTNDMT